MYFDTHAHYDDEKFDTDRDAVLQEMANHNVGLIVNPGCTVESSKAAIALAEQYPFIYAAVGIHPENCQGATEADFQAIEALTAHPKVKAVGEIGLDYYWEKTPEGRAFQREVLQRLLDLARTLNLPAIMHDRDAHQDCMNAVRANPQVRGVFHCYSGSLEDAKVLVSRGWMLSFGGSTTFRSARRAPEVIQAIPLEFLMLETDSPYLAPVPYRGKRNDSRNLPLIAAKIAEIKGISVEEVEWVTTENGKRFFGIE
ncbi:MAG: TatD family hydrolase [Oscillospiraceae bacterium]|nr:TatD family hydrolase [Oscillospiraceae bacterium]